MSEAAPLVSVIIATYNWSSVLRHAIESVRGQTFGDFEILVMGDGCTDDSEAVAGSFGDGRIVWRNLGENSGSQSMPNNAGLELARGKYVAYHGHDDIWLPTHLELLVKAMETGAVDLAHTLTVVIGPPGTGVRRMWGISGSGGYEGGMFLPPSSIMHQREVGRKVGGWRGYRTLKIPPDAEFVSRLWGHRGRFSTVNELTVFKFPSAWRKNSYVEKPCHEQAEYLERIRGETDFLEREWREIARAYVLRKSEMPAEAGIPMWTEDSGPGEFVEQMRRVRGLEARELPAAARGGGARKLYKRSKRELQRVLRGLARRLGDWEEA